MKINATNVKKLAVPEKGAALHWDDALSGFGVRITATGTVAYVAQARVNGKTRRVTIGKAGVIAADEARRKARTTLGNMSDGRDPVAEKRRQKALSVTLGEVTDTYLENRRTRSGRPLKDRTKADVRYHLAHHFGDWRERPVVEITREMVQQRYSKLCRSSVAQANQAFRVLSAIIRYAAATYRTPDGARIIADNPVEVLRDASMLREVKPKSTMVPLDRIGEWWSAVQTSRNDPALTPASRAAADLVALLALTGLRLGEARSIRWDQLDLEGGSLTLTDTKNRRDVTLPLSDLAVEIIRERENRTPYVFPARSGNGCLKDCRGHLQKLTDQTGIEVTAHDLRRTFRAVAAQVGVELWRTKALMNHAQNQDITLAAYTDLQDVRYLRDEANQIAGHFEAQRKVHEADNVVTMGALA